MGCRIYGFREGNAALKSCPHYRESENLFTICNTCHITVPKICVSLGECVNCTDTDLFCVDQCLGGEMRKYCTHFVRLCTGGAHLIEQGSPQARFSPQNGPQDEIVLQHESAYFALAVPARAELEMLLDFYS
jgi:hypothetical protein